MEGKKIEPPNRIGEGRKEELAIGKPEEEERKTGTVTDRWDPHVGDSRRDAATRGAELGWQAAGQARPKEMRARAGKRSWAAETGRCGGLRKENSPKAARRRRIPFLFLFQFFKSIFSIDFQIKFEFDLNHTSQNSKCSSMNAQSCFYPYI
jgi:hypothetical protein